MSETTSRQISEFEAALIFEINRLKTFVKPQFRVPGTRTTLDIYIASPVRAFVEIKFGRAPSSSEIRRLRQQTENVCRTFGGEIFPILVAGSESWRSSSLVQKLRDMGFFVVKLASSKSAVRSAVECAEEIRNFLAARPYHFKGIDDRFPSAASMSETHSATPPVPPTKSQRPSMEEILASIRQLLADERHSGEYGCHCRRQRRPRIPHRLQLGRTGR